MGHRHGGIISGQPPPPSPPRPRTVTSPQKHRKYEARGAEEQFSLGHTGTAAVLLLPLCGATNVGGGCGGVTS